MARTVSPGDRRRLSALASPEVAPQGAWLGGSRDGDADVFGVLPRIAGDLHAEITRWNIHDPMLLGIPDHEPTRGAPQATRELLWQAERLAYQDSHSHLCPGQHVVRASCRREVHVLAVSHRDGKAGLRRGDLP